MGNFQLTHFTYLNQKLELKTNRFHTSTLSVMNSTWYNRLIKRHISLNNRHKTLLIDNMVVHNENPME